MSIKLRNFTPHNIVIYNENGDKILETLPSEGVARASEQKETIGSVSGFPLLSMSYGNLSGLPDPEEGVLYVVSIIAATAAINDGRDDCIIVSDTVRNEKGQIIGNKAFARI